MQNKTYQKTIRALLLSLWVLFHFSCTTEESIDEVFLDTRDAQNAFSLKDYKDAFVKENLVVNWNNYTIIEDDHTVYEFEAKLNNKEATEEYAIGYKIKYKVLATKKNAENSWLFEILKFNIIEAENTNNISINKLHSFTGTLYEYNLSGEMLRIKAIEAGTLVDEMKFTDKPTDTSVQSLSNTIAMKTMPPDWGCGEDGNDNCSDGNLVENTSNTYSDGFSMQGPTVYITSRRTQTRYYFAYSTRGPAIYSIHIGNLYRRTFERYGSGSNGSGEVPLGTRHNTIKDKLLENGELAEVLADDLPPSCESFDFVNTSSNWQEASVIGIRFSIVVIEIVAGIRIKKVIPIGFPQPVKFGMPRTFNNGSSISEGLAAETSALAIEDAIDDVISRYNNVVVNSTDVIRSHFQDRLKHNMRERSNGGRVNFNDMSSSLTPTLYKTSAIIRDNCN